MMIEIFWQENIPALLILAPAAVAMMLPSASLFSPFPIELIQGTCVFFVVSFACFLMCKRMGLIE